jgi:iron complex outermembrane receptor protein
MQRKVVQTELSRRHRATDEAAASRGREPGRGRAISSAIGLIARVALLSLLAHAIHAKASAAQLADSLDIEVGSGPVASALLAIGQRYGVIVSFQPNLVEGCRTAALRGRFTLDQALDAALRGSDLAADIAAEGIVTVKRVSRAEAAARTAPATETAQPAREDAATPRTVELEDVVILAKAAPSFGGSENGFMPTVSETATLNDTPLSRVPQAVSVVTQDMLAASQVRTQFDALGYATGVTSFGGGTWGFESATKIRGFPAPLLLSGLSSYRTSVPLESAAIERIEVLKGPSGAVGGVTEEDGRGGVINIVRKRPYAGQKPVASLQLDSLDGGILHANADVGGGSSEGETLWRLVAYGSRGLDRPTAAEPVRTDGMLGSLSHRAGDLSTTLTLQHERRRDPPPSLARNRLDDEASTYTVSHEEAPTVSREDGRRSRVDDAEVDAQWRLSDRWRLSARARWERAGFDMRSYQYLPQVRVVQMERMAVKARAKSWRWNLLGDLQTGPVKHKLLIATDRRHHQQALQYTSANWYAEPETFQPGQTPLAPTPDLGSLALMDLGEGFSAERGVMLQDQLRFGDATVRLAMRRSRYRDAQFGDPDERRFTGRSWDAGASYRLLPDVTVYAGAQAAVEASLYAGRDVDNLAVPPGTSRQQQIGAKVDLNEGLALTLEAYRLRQHNSLYFTVDTNYETHPRLVPGKASTGIELELAGRAGAALDISVGVNLMRTRQQQLGGPDEVYWCPILASPQRSMHLLADYRLPQSLVTGTSIGLALRAQSGSWVIPPDPEQMSPALWVPGGAQLDVSSTRRDGHWSFGMTLHNVFDRRLYSPTLDTNFVPLNRGRSVSLTLRYQG